MAGEQDPGVDRQEVLREFEAAVFEPPRPVLPPLGVPEEPPPPPAPAPAPGAAWQIRRGGLAGAALALAGAGWLAVAMVARNWIACALSAALLTAGLLFLGRAFLREKP